MKQDDFTNHWCPEVTSAFPLLHAIPRRRGTCCLNSACRRWFAVSLAVGPDNPVPTRRNDLFAGLSDGSHWTSNPVCPVSLMVASPHVQWTSLLEE